MSILRMSYVPRSFVTNIWIMVHTLATYIQGQCLNPWEAEATDPMHTASPSSPPEIQKFAQVLHTLYQHTVRLSQQLLRAYHIVHRCELKTNLYFHSEFVQTGVVSPYCHE